MIVEKLAHPDVRDAMFADVAHAQGILRGTRYTRGASSFIIELPHDCGVTGSVGRYRGIREAYLGNISVHDNLRRMGIGSRLLRMWVAAAQDRGATVLYGDVISRELLQTKASVLGVNNLRFAEIPKNYPNGRSRRINLPLEILLNEFQPLRVFADISLIDTTGWERAVESLR